MSKRRTRQRPTQEAPPEIAGRPQKPGWQEIFLEEFACRANVLAACQAADVHRSTAYEARDSDPDFRARWALAKADAVDRLAAVARSRAVEGWEEPVFAGGVCCGYVTKYDNGLLWKLLAAHDPETYGQKVQNTHSGAGGGPIRHAWDLSRLTDDQLRALEELAAAAAPGDDPGGAGAP
jgi:hypothetical protein